MGGMCGLGGKKFMAGCGGRDIGKKGNGEEWLRKLEE